jgi:hypothetical protein
MLLKIIKKSNMGNIMGIIHIIKHKNIIQIGNPITVKIKEIKTDLIKFKELIFLLFILF